MTAPASEAKRRRKLTLARELSYDAFTSIMHGKNRADEVSKVLYQDYKNILSPLDYRFLKEILYGGLRWYGKIFWILQNTSKRNIKDLPKATQSALILGTYQIFYMDRVPDRSAVNESVEYVRAKGEKLAVPYVNGVLRSISRRCEYFAKPDKTKQPVKYLSLQYSHPKWIVERWLDRFGFEKTKNLLLTNNKIPPCTIRINPLSPEFKGVVQFQHRILKEEKQKTQKQHLPYCLQLKSYNLFDKDSLFSKGSFTIQDEAAQLIGHIVNPKEGETILDACIGPGGKSGQIYEATNGKVHIIGLDKSKEQIKKAQQNFSRLQHNDIELVHQDFLGTNALKKGSKFDKILLDAPCSGLGVLRRHPEGKWLKKASIIIDCAELQRKMLDKSISLLKDDGELIYSVCSFEPEETIEQLEYVLSKYSDTIELVCIKSRIHDYYQRFVCRSGILIILHALRDNMDGFGAFVVKKKKIS
jgi:16S rRNA (cytosine967-C5)-methyltransferase